MAFQRKKQEAIGIKAPFPGFIEPELATSLEKASFPKSDTPLAINSLGVEYEKRQILRATASSVLKIRLWLHSPRRARAKSEVVAHRGHTLSFPGKRPLALDKF
jgi:hypothetical protein